MGTIHTQTLTGVLAASGSASMRKYGKQPVRLTDTGIVSVSTTLGAWLGDSTSQTPGIAFPRRRR